MNGILHAIFAVYYSHNIILISWKNMMNAAA